METGHGKENWVLWFYGEPIVAQKGEEDGKTNSLFCYSRSKFEEIGVTVDEIAKEIEEFVRNKDERTVMSVDIESYELVDLDANK